MRKLFYFILIPIIAFSCTDLFISKESKWICGINSAYYSGSSPWEKIDSIYSIKHMDTINDSIFYSKYKEIKALLKHLEWPENFKILFFNDENKELLVISDNHYGVRFAYNPKINNFIKAQNNDDTFFNEEFSDIIDGMSNIPPKERLRIALRVNMLILPYQTDEGKFQTMQNIIENFEEFKDEKNWK